LPRNPCPNIIFPLPSWPAPCQIKKSALPQEPIELPTWGLQNPFPPKNQRPLTIILASLIYPGENPIEDMIFLEFIRKASIDAAVSLKFEMTNEHCGKKSAFIENSLNSLIVLIAV
jgi:hypothetical protein